MPHLQASGEIPKAALEQVRGPMQQTRDFTQTEIAALAEGLKGELTGAESRMSVLEDAVQSVSAGMAEVAEQAEAASSAPYSELTARLASAEARAEELERAARDGRLAAEQRDAEADERIERLEGVVAALEGLLRAGPASRSAHLPWIEDRLAGIQHGSSFCRNRLDMGWLLFRWHVCKRIAWEL